jgi:hypothetical protein
MNSQHSTKAFSSLFICLTLTCALAPAPVMAQRKSRGTATRTSTSTARPSDEKGAARRAQAINLLIETAERARTFDDLLYRARIQALAADALWAFDEARARQIFRRAWEAAAASDRAEQRASEEEAGVFSNSDEVTWTAGRDEVLSRVAARDEKLADVFLRELIEEQQRAVEAKANQATRRTPWREPSPMGARRLALAYELLNQKEYARAAAVAEPLINEGVSGSLVEFIVRLRAVSGSLGLSERLYLRLLGRAMRSPNTDANDVLLLSSYIVSPQLLMVVDEKGSLQFRSLSAAPLGYNPAEGIAAEPLYRLAASVLLQRNSRTTNSLQEKIARYVVIGRLVPFFERAGAEYSQFVPAMRSQLAQLSGEMEAGRGLSLKAQFELTSLNSKNASDPLAPQLEQLTRAGDKAERDRISLSIVMKAARERLWDRAQRAAYQIEDGDARRAALSFIAVTQIADIPRAYKDAKEDDFEGIARFVRRAEAPPFASAWGLSQAAVIAARKGTREEISALLSEAESYAARSNKDSRQRVVAYIVITDAAARVYPERAWDFMSELVRAANSTPDYTGEETSLATSTDAVEGSELQEELSINSDTFRLDRIFATMARIDFDKTLTQAQALAGDIPRAYARIAAARAALEKAVTSDE